MIHREPSAALLPFAVAMQLASAMATAQQGVPLDPPALLPGSVVYDTTRSRAVAFGLDGEVWELDGSAWLHRAVTTGQPRPTPRRAVAMAFDPARGAIVFGGRSGTTLFGDGWAWNGADWSPLPGATTPPARQDAALAFDTVRGRLVLYGGISQSPTFSQVERNDTWEHDGTQWLQRTPATAPAVPGFGLLRMVFDDARGVCVLLGDGGRQHWEWDGVDWTRRAAPVAGFAAPTLTWDPVRRRTVLLGGHPTPGATNPMTVWEYDGNTWNAAGTTALVRRGMSSWYDARRSRIVLHGGSNGIALPSSDLWEWDGTAATFVAADREPPRNLDAAWTRDPATGDVIVFGGQFAAPSDETWAFDGNGWRRLAPFVRPAPRYSASTTIDLGGGRALLFGGSDGAQAFGDLWALSAGTWSAVAPALASGPSPRVGAAIAFDEVRSLLLLFGGDDPTTAQVSLADTWEWNGIAWARRAPTLGPPARAQAAMAWDPVRGRSILFGGRNVSGPWLDDTWEWDGAQWLAVTTPTRPAATEVPSLVYDRTALHAVLAAGDLNAPLSAPAVPLWRYDGVDWTLLATRRSDSRSRLVYDERRGRVVAWSPTRFVGGARVEEWTTTAAAADRYGAGCGAPEPQFAVRARARTGDPAFGLECRSPGAAVALFAVASSQGNVPIGSGCSALLGPVLASALQFADASGVAVQPLPLPRSAALRGAVLFAQAGVLSATGVLSVSAGLRIAIGD